MGTWGIALFSDDAAADVRLEYRDLLSDGLEPAEATRRLIERWSESISDPDDGPVFWIALALTQHRLGHLEQRVRREAQRVLDGELGLDRWKEARPSVLKKRREALSRVAAELASPLPRARRVPRRFKDTCTWPVGEHVAYRLRSGRVVVFRMIGVDEHAGGVSPVVQVLDGEWSKPPSDAALAAAGVRSASASEHLLAQGLMTTYPEWPNVYACRALLLQEMGLLEGTLDLNSPLGVLPALAELHRRGIDPNRPPLEALRRIAQVRRPELLEPLAQFSLRRVEKRTELPSARVTRLGSPHAETPAVGRFVAFLWTDLDEGLADLFGVR